MIRRSANSALLALALLWAAPAAAEPARPAQSGEPFRVAFSSTTSCRNPGEFVDEVLRRSKRLRPGTSSEAGVSFVIELNDTQSGTEGTLSVVYRDGAVSERSVPGADCHEVISAMALIGVLMVESDPARPRLPPPRRSSVRPSAPAPEPPARPRSRWSFGLAQSLRLESGPLPAMAVAEALHAELGYAFSELWRSSVRISGHTARRRVDTAAEQLLGSAAFHVSWARVAVCPLVWVPLESLTVKPCAFGEAGNIHAEGYRIENGYSTEVFMMAAGAELALELRLAGPLTLRAELGPRFMLAPAAGEEFYLQARRPGLIVFEVPGVGFSGGLGAGLSF